MKPMSYERLEELEEKMASLGLDPQDLEETFCRSGGPGGQHANRTATAVRLRHGPSGLEVRAEDERSQLRNRIAAREILLSRWEALQKEKAAARQAAAELKKRQSRRPPPGARKKNVENKRRRGEVKRLRGKVTQGDS